MPIDIRISAKDLGAIAMPDFCPRCFWIKRNSKKLPFQIFPGIFSSIDSYSKKIVHAWFDTKGCAPPWIPEIKDAVRYMKAPHWSKFKRTDPVTGITVSGVVDDYFECADGSHIIPDYKTAKFTETQDALRPMYEAQLNGYAWIDEGFGFEVKSIPLVYCEPVTDPCENAFVADGFNMRFAVKAIQIQKDTAMIPGLLQKAMEILESPNPPAGVDGCKDCDAVMNLAGVAQ